jgi:hypothetical protein
MRYGQRAMGRVSIRAQWLGGRGRRFARLNIRAHSGLVYRLVALSSIMAIPGCSAGVGSAGWGGSAAVRRTTAIRGRSLLQVRGH